MELGSPRGEDAFVSRDKTLALTAVRELSSRGGIPGGAECVPGYSWGREGRRDPGVGVRCARCVPGTLLYQGAQKWLNRVGIPGLSPPLLQAGA